MLVLEVALERLTEYTWDMCKLCDMVVWCSSSSSVWSDIQRIRKEKEMDEFLDYLDYVRSLPFPVPDLDTVWRIVHTTNQPYDVRAQGVVSVEP